MTTSQHLLSLADRVEGLNVLDLFSAAAGGWSLGMHRAGFHTMAACEVIPWRRALYSENNPGVKVYDDVRTLSASRLLDDFGYLPSIVVGSPPCQDISSANTKGKGVEGERSGLYFEAVRIVGECRPRWFAFENSANLRTRGADRVIAALADIGYACWPFVVGADDVGANHERKRSWLIGCDVEQFTDADGFGRDEGWSRGRRGIDLSLSDDPIDTARFGHEGGRARRHGPDGHRAASVAAGDAANAHSGPVRIAELPGRPEPETSVTGDADKARNTPDPDQARRDQGRETGWAEHLGASTRPAIDGASGGSSQARSAESRDGGQVAICPPDRRGAVGSRTGWSLDDLAGRLFVDARISGWTFIAFLLDEGGYGCLADQLITELRSVGFAEDPTPGSDLRVAMRTLLASYSENTARNLAPIAEKLLADFNITIALEGSWEELAKSAAEMSGLASTTLTKTGPTTRRAISRRSANRAIPDTMPERELRAVHRRAGRRARQSAARLVEAYGDAVLPQIPECIGKAILRTEAALAHVYRVQ